MAVFKGAGVLSNYLFVVFRCSVLLLVANHQFSAGDILMWTAPPPAWNQTIAGTGLAKIQTAVYPVRNGSTNVLLRWNYTLLPGQTLVLTSFSTGDGISQEDIGLVIGGPTGTPNAEYEDLYSIYSTSQFSNLTINKVTVQENATFQCKLQVGANVWAYNIRVEVTDPAVITHISGNETVNETDVVTLNCSAKGMPTPIPSWTRVSDNSSMSFPLIITGKQDEGGYRCTAENGIGNPASQVVYIIVENYHPIDTNLRTSLAGNSVVVNTSFNITCSAQANPPAMYKFYRDQNNFDNDTTGSDVSVITTSVSERRKQVNYSCTPFNYFGDGLTDGLTLTVLYAPDATTLTTVPSNRTLLRNSIMSLNCETNASPEAEYHFFFNGESIVNSTSGVFNVTVEADGVYACVPINKVGTGGNATVKVTTVVAPSVKISNETAIVVEGENLVLTCNPSGIPEPNVTWTKRGTSEVLSNTSSLTIVNVSRPEPPGNMIQYQCRASNGVGTPATATSTIDVYYAASVIYPANVSLTVEPKTEVNFLCLGTGNPAPTVNWSSPNKDMNWMSNLTNVTFTAESYSYGLYLCTVKNVLGEAIKRFHLDVEDNSILTKLTVTNRGCNDNPLETCKQLGEKVEEKIKRNDKLKEPTSVTVENCKCGSVTAYLSLDFTQNVKISDVISVLKEAAEGNGYGDFQVDAGSIQAISKEQLPTDFPSSTVGTTTSEDDKDKVKLWIIIGASVGGALVLAIVVAVVAWCVHHKRKCRRKGSKVRCSESNAFAPEEGNDYGYANNGYADAGPRPSEMEDVSQHQGASGSAAVPTYAIVDKSAKKESKKDKKVEEEKPQAAPPQYAAVDKSKKKKKEEPEATYAQVDKSKKSKKQKPKPDEVVYADLGDYHQMKELPAVSTSPQALPPIKKPTPYGETQYADITQFLKGDATLPESNNSQGPGTGTQAPSAPENSNSQEPAGTSTKETSQASNPGGDGGPGHETNF